MHNPVVVAGAGPTLGTAMAREFAGADYPVALLSRSGDHTDDLVADLRDAGHEATAIRADVTDQASLGAAFEEIREWVGPPEVVVHNATAGAGGNLEACDPETFESVWRNRAYGGFLLAKEAASDLRKTGGALLFSGTDFADGEPGRVAWSSGGSATLGLARSLVDDLEGAQVTYVALEARVVASDDPGPRAVAAGDVAETYRNVVEQETAISTELNLRTVL